MQTPNHHVPHRQGSQAVSTMTGSVPTDVPPASAGLSCALTRCRSAQAKRAAVLGGSIFSRAGVAAGKRQLEAIAAAKAARQRSAAQARHAGEDPIRV